MPFSRSRLSRLSQRRCAQHLRSFIYHGDHPRDGLLAHTRRNFYDAKESDPGRAHVVLAHIRRLYATEAEARELIAEKKLAGPDADAVRYALRQQNSVAELAALRQWLQDEQANVLPKA